MSHTGKPASDEGVITIDLAAMRENYTAGQLSEKKAPAHPAALFDAWLAQAVQARLPEPSAMTLATVGNDLRPSTRIVLLKGHDAHGLVWFTNYQSRKAVELAGNPHAALQFHWTELQRVVRIEGRVEKIAAEESDRYFHSRPLPSRIGAWVSPQSRPVPDRESLDQAFENFAAELTDLQGPARPPFWGGYRLVPERWEFWQGRTGRLHDRLVYERQDTDWHRLRIAP